MKHYSLFKALCYFVFVVFPFCLQAKDAEPRNIILFIGDGMSLAQWQTGMIMSDKPLNIERMRSVGIVRTNSLTDFNGDGPSHGTAIASGVNTRKGTVGLDSDGKPVKSIMEYAAENQIATGVVSANTLLEGSIAPFVAHVESRMQTEDIAKAYVEQTPDVFIGGGMRYFTERKDGQDLLAILESKGYHIAESMDEIRNVHEGKLAGFISETNVPDISRGRGDSLTESVLDFAEKEGNTLVVVVGGPEASGMVLVGGDIPQHEVTAKWAMQGMIHTGTMVPVFSYGVGAERFQGIMKNTDLFFHIKELLLNENKVYGQRDSL